MKVKNIYNKKTNLNFSNIKFEKILFLDLLYDMTYNNCYKS